MLLINTISYYDEDNIFRLKEVLISDGKVTYSLSPDTNFAEDKYDIPLEDMVLSARYNVSYPVLGFNKTRRYKDDDAHSLAVYLAGKFRSIGEITTVEERIIFDIMAGFGEEADV